MEDPDKEYKVADPKEEALKQIEELRTREIVDKLIQYLETKKPSNQSTKNYLKYFRAEIKNALDIKPHESNLYNLAESFILEKKND